MTEPTMTDHLRPRLITSDELPLDAVPQTAGMERRVIFEGDGVWVGRVRTEAGKAGGWHHHGDHDSYIYVIEGSLAIDAGPGGRERVVGGPGDVIVNPRGIIHREVTGPEGPAEVLVVRVGSGPTNVNVEGPDPEG
jgi:quercetin dioxygenase-like cupin family protein